MRAPLVVVTGIHPLAMDATMLGLAWDLPTAVSVRHHIDPVSQVLTRTVSDAGGVLERAETRLEHVCVGCALREDILPTLERLARTGRWSAIVAGLPTATEADQLVHVLAHDRRLARHLRLTGVVAAVGSGAVGDLLGEDLLLERGVQTDPDDERGVGEVACSQVELADVVVLDEDPHPGSVDLVRALARPDATVVVGTHLLDPVTLVAGRRNHSLADAWRLPQAQTVVPSVTSDGVWRVDLCSPRPFHPDRLLDQVERLGAGAHRSRGAFWVPTRPGDLLGWSGAGGQLSIFNEARWGRGAPVSRVVLTGLGTAPTDLAPAFEDLLLTPAEAQRDPASWAVLEDGLEPWLGDIRDAA